ncbi:MAG: sulfurtransferase TusA family protein [Rhodospirillales bacterium]|nr:sulfurtransferase TusA family protein [Rhodospirillales bacterium]
MTNVTTLDVKGLNCPLPILRARKALGTIAPGGTLRVLATDPGATRDFEAFCRAGDATLVSSSEADGVFVFDIRKAG